MFCPHCGAQLPDESTFCNQCGKATDVSAKISAPNPLPPIVARSKRPAAIGIIVAVLAVIAIGVIAIPKLMGDNEKEIDIVRNGYLGVYTDVTVGELIQDAMTKTNLAGTVEWSRFEDKEDNKIVEARIKLGSDEACFQFKLTSLDCFRIYYMDVAGAATKTSADILAWISQYYSSFYCDRFGDANNKILEKLSSAPAAYALCGAAASYTGDRASLYKTYWPSPVDETITAVELLDLDVLLGETVTEPPLDTSTDAVDYSGYSGTWFPGATSEESIYFTVYLTVDDMDKAVFYVDYNGVDMNGNPWFVTYSDTGRIVDGVLSFSGVDSFTNAVEGYIAFRDDGTLEFGSTVTDWYPTANRGLELEGAMLTQTALY